MAGRKTGKGRTLELDAIRAATLQRPPDRMRGGRSPVYDWLAARYDELVPILNPPARPFWDGLAAEVRSRFPDVLDGEGKPPTGERMRKAWWQVRRDKGGSVRVAGVKAVAPVLQAKVEPDPKQLPGDDDDFLQFAEGRKV